MQQAQLMQQNFNDKILLKMLTMIGSMTKQERLQPDLLNSSRKNRICKGSGCDMTELNRLLKQQKQMSKMLQKMKGGKSVDKIMRQFKQGKPQFPGLA